MSYQWHEVCALLLSKMGTDHVVIEEEDFAANQGFCISAEVKDNALHIRRLPNLEAERIMTLHNMPPSDPN